jgi:hypothetical protein
LSKAWRRADEKVTARAIIGLVVCALKRHVESSGGNPDRRCSSQPEALGADQEVTNGLKHSKKRLRWVVERTHSWMNRFRRIFTQWEKKAANYLGLLHLVCAVITYRCAGLFG